MQTRRLPPIPLLALTNATYGMYIGFCAASLPILLAGRHVPEARIAAITAIVLTPMFWSFLLGPLLDVRFRRRSYAWVFATLAAILLAAGLVTLQGAASLTAAETLILLGTLAVSLSQYALGGWLVSLVPQAEETRLSAWFNVANIGGAGFMVLAAGALLRRLPPPLAATSIALLLLLPLLLFPLIPNAADDLQRARRLAAESFARFFAELFTLLRRRDVLLALAVFLTPCASFAMTNVLAGLGADFHAPEPVVSLVAGLGTVVAGIAASLLLPRLARGRSLRWLYVAIGVVGALFTLCLRFVPHTPAGFALAMVGETFFQTLAITNAFALQFELVGPGNPFAATLLAVLGSAMNLPMTYMVYLDGRAYACGSGAGGPGVLTSMLTSGPASGLAASTLLDGLCGLLACAVLIVLLRTLRGRLAA